MYVPLYNLYLQQPRIYSQDRGYYAEPVDAIQSYFLQSSPISSCRYLVSGVADKIRTIIGLMCERCIGGCCHDKRVL